MSLKKLKAMMAVSAFLFCGHALATQEPEAVPGEYIVKLKDEYQVIRNKSATTQISKKLGSYVRSVLPEQNIVIIKRATFEINASVVKSLSQNPMVEVVEPNYIYHASRAPNDPLLGRLWGLNNIGQEDSSKQQGIAGIDIGADRAWDIETGSRDVVVAVIDTGVDYNNSDLKENIWVNEAEANGLPGVDDDQNGFVDDIHGYNFVGNNGNPMDDHGHGSHCAGTIGAKGDDNAGIVGVAWNTRIMGVKFLDKNGSGTLENALKAIDYATKMGAKISSNSWGGGGASDTLRMAIERAHAANVLFVAAAGNESNHNDSSPTYPASYAVPNVLAVAAVDNRGQMASFSNYGRRSVHVGAPGVNILSSTPGGYQSWSGTSMATPHVSGIAVLLASKETALTNLELKERIISTAQPIAGLTGKVKSGGIANAYRALTNEVAPPNPEDPENWQNVVVSISTAHPYVQNANETYTVSAPGAKQIAIYFDQFDTEKSYDVATIYDANGKKIQAISGAFGGSYSNIIDGDSATIVFKSDASVQKHGFDITKVAYR